MFKFIKLFVILGLLFNLAPTLAMADGSYFSNISVYNIQNGRATIKWTTAMEATKGFVYYSTDANNLDKSFGYGVYDYRHESILTGLNQDETYYFKIIAYNQLGSTQESFIQSFSTKGMTDTTAPEFLSKTIVQKTKDAVIIDWTANEKVDAEISYGLTYLDLNKSLRSSTAKTEYEAVITGLDTDQLYYVRIIIKDSGGNKKEARMTFRTDLYIDKNTPLEIYDIRPISSDPAYISSETAKIEWKTNLAAKSKIGYGTKSGEYSNIIEFNTTSRKTQHSIYLEKLSPNTTYYYKVKAYDSLYGKELTSPEYTFTTNSFSTPNAPQPPILNTNFDTDNDGLSDAYESEIGTDPIHFDTDGDGYNDGLEIKYGYDPLIPGSTAASKLQAYNYYQPKRANDIETASLQKLKVLVKNSLGNISISDKNWVTLNRAYMYGGYPLEAITQAVRFGGKTVHPTIPYSSWKNAETYRSYIYR